MHAAAAGCLKDPVEGYLGGSCQYVRSRDDRCRGELSIFRATGTHREQKEGQEVQAFVTLAIRGYLVG